MRFSAERAFESLRHDAEHEATKGPNHAGGRASYPPSPTIRSKRQPIDRHRSNRLRGGALISTWRSCAGAKLSWSEPMFTFDSATLVAYLPESRLLRLPREHHHLR